MTDHPALPPSPRPPGSDCSCPATAATVALATAARALGISQDAAVDLAERDEFPCDVIRTSAGYRVCFSALLRLLRSAANQRTRREGPRQFPGSGLGE